MHTYALHYLHMLVTLLAYACLAEECVCNKRNEDIPWAKLELAERVVDLQKSDKSSLNMSAKHEFCENQK